MGSEFASSNALPPVPSVAAGVLGTTAVKVQQAIPVAEESRLQLKVELENCFIEDGQLVTSGDDGEDECGPCDACPHCFDVCRGASTGKCASCAAKAGKEWAIVSGDGDGSSGGGVRKGNKREQQRRITACQVRRHRTIGSPWLVVDDCVVDCTDYILSHPGGIQSILRRAGSTESCRADYDMHTAGARKQWKKRSIGVLVECPGCRAAAAASGDGTVANSACSDSNPEAIYEEARPEKAGGCAVS